MIKTAELLGLIDAMEKFAKPIWTEALGLIKRVGERGVTNKQAIEGLHNITQKSIDQTERIRNYYLKKGRSLEEINAKLNPMIKNRQDLIRMVGEDVRSARHLSKEQASGILKQLMTNQRNLSELREAGAFQPRSLHFWDPKQIIRENIAARKPTKEYISRGIRGMEDTADAAILARKYPNMHISPAETGHVAPTRTEEIAAMKRLNEAYAKLNMEEAAANLVTDRAQPTITQYLNYSGATPRIEQAASEAANSLKKTAPAVEQAVENGAAAVRNSAAQGGAEMSDMMRQIQRQNALLALGGGAAVGGTMYPMLRGIFSPAQQAAPQPMYYR